MKGVIAFCFVLLAVPVWGQEYPLEKEPFIDPVRVFEALSGASFDEPRDESQIIDQQFYFTANTWARCGGTEAGCTAYAEQVVAQFNQAAINEELTVRMRFCGAYRVSYVEGVGTYANSPLSWMAVPATSGGGRDEVWALLTGRGCDLGILITTNNACGQGYLRTSSGNPWAQGEYGCCVGNKTCIHEIGHNIGLHHDPQSACGQATCSGYNYGHAWPTTGVIERDPMTYPGAGGSRVLWWSSPLFIRHGQPIGIEGQRDNRRVIDERAAIVAGFRALVAPTETPAPPGKPIPVLED